MSMKDGKVQWRRVTAPDTGVHLLRTVDKGLISASDGGNVQAWKGNGDLLWQRTAEGEVVDLLIAGKQNVVIVGQFEVEARNLVGKHEWSAKSDGKASFRAAAISESDGHICAVKVAGSTAMAQKLEVTTGKVVSEEEMPAEAADGISSGDFIVVDANLVVLANGKLSAFPFCGGEPDSLDLSEVKGQGPHKLQPWQRTRGVFAVTDGSQSKTTIFGIGQKGLKQLRTLDGVAVVGPVFSVHDDETGQPVALAMTKQEGTQIQLMDPASGNVQPAVEVAGFTSKEHGQSRLLLVHELRSGDHHTVISAADHTLAGIQAAKVDWMREEGLASSQKADFYSRHTKVGKASSDADTSLVAQLAAVPGHLAELLKAPLEIAAYLTRVITARRLQDTEGLLLMPDAEVPSNSEELRNFGADKLILAVTSAPKLYALESTTSAIAWTNYIGPSPVECKAVTSGVDKCSVWMQLLPSSASSHAELVVIVPGKDREIMWLDPLTGKKLHTERVSGVDIAAVMPLPRQGLQPIQPLLIVDSNKGLHLFPSDAPELQALAGSVFHYEIDTVAQAVNGFVVPGSQEGARPKNLVPIWNMGFSDGEKIVASATPQLKQWGHVPVHIKGDASILYKYINPNMLAVVSQDSHGLNLYTLDAVTGHLLHQSVMQGGATPVHLVACDNWIVMHYRNAERTRFEVAVTEFFQAKADEGPWDILFPGKQAAQTKSAHSLEVPVPLQQTYIVPTGLTSIGVTATLKGITPRSIVMAMATNQITRVSKDMLNPRRPHAGTVDKKSMPAQFAPTKDEMLMPYTSMLPIRQTDTLNYHKAIGSVTGIASSPTALESTSLVFAYGLDLFFTPVQTAKAYDVLSPGFNYLLLYTSVTIVAAVWLTVSFLASRKALQDRWK